MNYELISVSHLLKGEFVEARIDIADGAGLSFCMRHDESHLGYALFGIVLTADANIREGDEPTVGHAGAAVLEVHRTAAVDFRVEVGCEAA